MLVWRNPNQANSNEEQGEMSNLGMVNNNISFVAQENEVVFDF